MSTLAFSRNWVLLLGLLCGLTIPAVAGELPAPKNDIVLDVSGRITKSNAAGDHAQFDMQMLQQMPVTVIKTATPWFEGVQKLSGVKLADILKAVGASGASIHAIALNDYMVEIPLGDAEKDGVIIAYAYDDEPMSVRDKGPLWIIYPLTDRPDLNTPEVQSKMIWQLKAMTIQ
jgi:hypothetical protein